MGFFSIIASLFLTGEEAVPVKSLPQEKCVTELTNKQKKRGAANIDEILKSIALLRTQSGELAFTELSSDLKRDIVEYFSAEVGTTSRLEQFYALLFILGREFSDRADELVLDVPSAQQILRAARVFPTPEFIDSLSEASVDYHPRRKRATWTIKLKQAEMEIPLNEGAGYLAFQHGLCQKVQSVLLYGGFQAEITKNSDKNIFVKFKDPIDFTGSFGSRGIVDIDLNFVSLFDIEFLRGTKIGVARVRISDREFEHNDHSAILRWASAILSQKAAQAIDW